MQLFATCKFGLEGVLAAELRALGMQGVQARDASVSFEGGDDQLCRANIWCRTADRLFLRAGEFAADSFEKLYEGTKAIAWEEYLPKDANVHVKGKTALSALHSVRDVQSIVKKAIADRLMAKYKLRWLPEDGTTYIVEAGLLKDSATLALDSSGEGLSRRGYRVKTAEAPLQETLAAALALLVRYDGGPFIDPMCGSGTIAIEAAMIAQNVAPGLQRGFAAEGWGFIPRQAWQRAREEAESLRRTEAVDVAGSDIDAEMVEMARFHAQRAGVAVGFAVADVRELQAGGRTLVCNPPYGERLMEKRQAEELYRALGSAYAAGSGKWCVFTSHPQFERFFGRRADKRRKLYNGGIPCQAYLYLR